MSLVNEIERIKTAKLNIKSSIEAKGVVVGNGTIDTYASAIDKIETGGGDVSEYFSNDVTGGQRYSACVLKLPSQINISGTDLSYLFDGFSLVKYLPNLIMSSKPTKINYIVNKCSSLLEFPYIDTSETTDFSSACAYCEELITIPLLDASSCVRFLNCLYNCKNLINLGGFKDIGKNYLTTQNANNSYYRIDLSICTNLTHDSIMNVINNLYDIASLGCKTQSLKLGTTNLAKISDEEKLIAQNKGWTLS